MKIKKLTESKSLLEADRLINPSAASAEEIATEIKDNIQEISSGESAISDAEAKNTAAVVADVADKIDADTLAPAAEEDSPLGVKNNMTDILDIALRRAKAYNRRRQNIGANVLICGLPGSGKTATVYDWARSNGINIHYLDAKSPDLQPLINGYPKATDSNEVIQAFSKVLDPLDRPNSVLFLDELNRQTKEYLRGSLLTLINEKAVSGNGPDGRRHFDNLLFTIACINPSVSSDRGASALNTAEKSRFAFTLKHMDSDPETTKDYFTKATAKAISRLDKNSPDYLVDLEEFLREKDLGIFIVKHADFKYDSMDDLDDLADFDCNMLNQRSLTELINNCGGDVNDLLVLIENTSDFLDRDKEMLKNILATYRVPTLEELLKLNKITVDSDLLNKEAETANEPTAEEPDESTETTEDEADDDELDFSGEDDDADFFNGGNAATAMGGVTTPLDVENRINDWLDAIV